jgi:hypothetical protein
MLVAVWVCARGGGGGGGSKSQRWKALTDLPRYCKVCLPAESSRSRGFPSGSFSLFVVVCNELCTHHACCCDTVHTLLGSCCRRQAEPMAQADLPPSMLDKVSQATRLLARRRQTFEVSVASVVVGRKGMTLGSGVVVAGACLNSLRYSRALEILRVVCTAGKGGARVRVVLTASGPIDPRFR